MIRSLHYRFFVLIVFAALLAACAPAQSPAAAPTSAQIPVTGVTATAFAATATSAPTEPAATTASVTAAPAATAASSMGGGTKYVLVPAKSEASYAVREQLARLNLPSDAVGTTNSITGSIVVKADGTIDSANSKFTVDLSTLKTDQAMRDNFVRQNVLHTSQNPLAVFVPKTVSGLPASLPQAGNVAFKVTGDMTIANVTKSITWDVSGTITGGEATGKATTSFTFEDFGLTQPRVPVVLSVVDLINLTVTVDLQVSSN